jgi:hypothetical protein
MRKGDDTGAIRVLPAEGAHPAGSPVPDPDGRSHRRWMLPLAVVGAALLAFLSATRPASQSDTEAASPLIPPGLSDASTELIDLTNPAGAEAMTSEWDEVPFDWPGQINDILPFNSSHFAFGSDDAGAAAWMSSTGSGWRDVTRFERPDNPESSVDQAVVWNGKVVALGSVGNEVGRWTARTLSRWFYEGTVPEMDDWFPQELAATDVVLAISSKEDRYRGWVSEDGAEWIELAGVSDLDEMVILSLVGIGDWFYAAGTERDQTGGRAVIYRSRDGEAWERVRGLGDGALSEADGWVSDLAQTANGLLAVGSADGEQIAVWESSDGAGWARVTTEGLPGKGTSVELLGISEQGEALFAIAGEEHRLVTGSRVLTDAGLMRVADVTDNYAHVEWVDGTREAFQAGSARRLVDLEVHPQRIAAQGPRVVVVGSVGIDRPMTPAVWTSTDGGSTWRADYPAPAVPGSAVAAAISRSNITVVGGNDRETPPIWHSTWNTQHLEDYGVELVGAYFDAVARRDSDSIAALLPDEPARFQIPSLGGVDLPWWDDSTGNVDPGRITDTMQYLQALNTRIELGECRTKVLLGDVDSLRVSCNFDVESDLLAVYSNETHSGTAEILVENGAIQQVHLTTVPSATMWQMLATGFGNQTAEERQALDDPTSLGIDPIFTAASAPVHLRITEEFIAGVLRPGDTRVVETVLGTMEWTWLESLPFPAYYVNWVARYGDGFVAIGQGEPERWTEQVTLWTSQDGVSWELMADQPDVTGLSNLRSFRNGLIAQGWEGERSFLTVYDGKEWGEIELPSGESGPYFDVRYLATSGDDTLIITVGWSEGYAAGPDAYQAWLIGPDNEPRLANLPIGFWESDGSIGLVGSDEGFVLGTAQSGSPQSMQIWFSQNGYDWEEIAATTSIENASYIWNLQRHQDNFYVVGEGAEANCSHINDGFCQQIGGLWSSADGTDWARVVTASGEPVRAYDFGSGPLGLVAMAADFYGNQPLPRPIYLSRDGSSWERAGNLALVHADAEWWWASLPAVGADTIVIPGVASDPSSSVNTDMPFLIVGRLIND